MFCCHLQILFLHSLAHIHTEKNEKRWDIHLNPDYMPFSYIFINPLMLKLKLKNNVTYDHLIWGQLVQSCIFVYVFTSFLRSTVLVSYNIWMIHLPHHQDLYKRGRYSALSGNNARLASQHFYINAYDPDKDGDYM